MSPRKDTTNWCHPAGTLSEHRSGPCKYLQLVLLLKLKGKPCDHLINLVKEVVGGDRKIGLFARFPAIFSHDLTAFLSIPNSIFGSWALTYLTYKIMFLWKCLPAYSNYIALKLQARRGVLMVWYYKASQVLKPELDARRKFAFSAPVILDNLFIIKVKL